jgi:hypothetical protein
MRISRRHLLAAAVAISGEMTLGRYLRADAPAAYPDRFQTDGGLVILPSKGELYIASDFHTRHADFDEWLKRTQLVEKLKDKEDVYGLILGDVVDAKPGDTKAEDDGDTRILGRIREIQGKLGEAGRRLVFIMGNHEREVMRVYEALKTKHGLNANNRSRLLKALYESDVYYSQFNFLERITDEQHAYLKQIPLAVVGKNGLVGIHAGPSPHCTQLAQIAKRDEEVVSDAVWSRPVGMQTNGGYTAEQLLDFLKAMENASLLVVGHTPLPLLPPQMIRDGIGVFAKRQVILATSYGAMNGKKSYLRLHLDQRYDGADDLKLAKEILRLDLDAAGATEQLPVPVASSRGGSRLASHDL